MSNIFLAAELELAKAEIEASNRLSGLYNPLPWDGSSEELKAFERAWAFFKVATIKRRGASYTTQTIPEVTELLSTALGHTLPERSVIAAAAHSGKLATEESSKGMKVFIELSVQETNRLLNGKSWLIGACKLAA